MTLYFRDGFLKKPIIPMCQVTLLNLSTGICSNPRLIALLWSLRRLNPFSVCFWGFQLEFSIIPLLRMTRSPTVRSQILKKSYSPSSPTVPKT